LASYYKIIFELATNYKYSIGDLENMIPFERDIYLSLLEQQQEKEIQDAKRSGNQ